MAKSTDKLTWGVLLLVAGIIYMMKKTGVLDVIPYGNKLTTYPVLILILGIILCATHNNKTAGIIVTIIGAVMTFGLLTAIPAFIIKYMLPLSLMAVGAYLIFKHKGK